MIRISDEAKRLLSTLWSPDGDVLRLVLRSPEADGARKRAFGHGRGEGTDHIVQHAGRQSYCDQTPARAYRDPAPLTLARRSRG